MQLTDKVALVTGAGSGIGRALAQAFAHQGAFVIVNDIDDSGKAVAEQVNGAFLKADLAVSDEVRRLAQEALAVRGSVDILINNAGFQHVSPVEEFPEEIWIKMIQVMLVAPFQLCKHLIPAMRQKGWGRILNIASIHGLVASPYKSAYVTAKHGLIGLTRTVALEVGGARITVNAICPAYVRTPLVEQQLKAQAAAHGLREEEVLERIMLEPAAIKRLIEPEEVAALALFLASEKAGAITGAAYLMDLGWTAR